MPHVVRLVCGPLHRRLLPLSALAGAVLMIWADTVARSLVDVARSYGVRCEALITAMDRPLGVMAGNALEVQESVDCLQGGGPADLRELTLRLADGVAPRLRGFASPRERVDLLLAYLVRRLLERQAAQRNRLVRCPRV